MALPSPFKWFPVFADLGDSLISITATVIPRGSAPFKIPMDEAPNSHELPLERVSIVVNGIRVPALRADAGGFSEANIDLEFTALLNDGDVVTINIGQDAPGWDSIDGFPCAGGAFSGIYRAE